MRKVNKAIYKEIGNVFDFQVFENLLLRNESSRNRLNDFHVNNNERENTVKFTSGMTMNTPRYLFDFTKWVIAFE